MFAAVNAITGNPFFWLLWIVFGCYVYFCILPKHRLDASAVTHVANCLPYQGGKVGLGGILTIVAIGMIFGIPRSVVTLTRESIFITNFDFDAVDVLFAIHYSGLLAFSLLGLEIAFLFFKKSSIFPVVLKKKMWLNLLWVVGFEVVFYLLNPDPTRELQVQILKNTVLLSIGATVATLYINASKRVANTFVYEYGNEFYLVRFLLGLTASGFVSRRHSSVAKKMQAPTYQENSDTVLEAEKRSDASTQDDPQDPYASAIDAASGQAECNRISSVRENERSPLSSTQIENINQFMGFAPLIFAAAFGILVVIFLSLGGFCIGIIEKRDPLYALSNSYAWVDLRGISGLLLAMWMGGGVGAIVRFRFLAGGLDTSSLANFKWGLQNALSDVSAFMGISYFIYYHWSNGVILFNDASESVLLQFISAVFAFFGVLVFTNLCVMFFASAIFLFLLRKVVLTSDPQIQNLKGKS